MTHGCAGSFRVPRLECVQDGPVLIERVPPRVFAGQAPVLPHDERIEQLVREAR
jgi:hypothetical protein